MRTITIHLQSGWFAVTTPVVGQMCHIKEVRHWFCFPVKHLVAVRSNRETNRSLHQSHFGQFWTHMETCLQKKLTEFLITMLCH